MALSISAERIPAVPDSRHDASELVDELIDGFRSLRPAEALLQHTEAAMLMRLKDEGVKRLGFVSIAVLAEELLGLRPRTTSERLRLARTLEPSVAARRAFLDGRVTTCQLLAVAPMLERPDADLWLDRATRLPVRVLRSLVRLARREEPVEEDEDEGRVVSFEAPVPFHSVWNTALETARRTIGHEVPVYRAIEAVLAESGASGTGTATTHEQRPIRMPTPPRRIVPRTAQCHPEAEARAQAVLADLKSVLAQLPLMVAQQDLEDPFVILDRLRAVRGLRNPLEHLRARILLALRTLNADAQLGYMRFDAFVEGELDLSPRTARQWIAEAHLYEDRPDLAEACSRGTIGSVSALLIRSIPSFDEEAWIERAQQVTVRQLVREIRFHVHLRQVDRRLASRFHGAFPHTGLEEALTEKLCGDHGWTVKALETFLREQGLEPVDPDAPHDPAENPIRQRRLELLLGLLANEAWNDPPEPETALPRDARQTSAREGTIRIRFWAPHAIADDWDAAIGEVRRKHGDSKLPVWAAAVILLHAAVEEWEKTDPEARPVKSRILKRDGYRCQMPGCRVRRNLESHHVTFRSRGGRDTIDNQITLCATHHRHVLHNGWATVRGRAAQALTWTLGHRNDRPPVLELSGERILSMRAEPISHEAGGGYRRLSTGNSR